MNSIGNISRNKRLNVTLAIARVETEVTVGCT